jgi:hypothetical protein
MQDVRRIQLESTPTAIALSGAGHLFVEMHTKREHNSATTLACFDLDGRLCWNLDLAIPSPTTLRVAEDGSPWIGSGDRLTQWGMDGLARHSTLLQWADGEQVGSFLLAPDGYYVCSQVRYQSASIPPRVQRYDLDGHLCWSTMLPFQPLSYDGVIEMSVESGWEARPKQPWQPRDWRPDRQEPMLLAGDRLLVSYIDYSSGISVSYALDALAGDLCWMASPRPSGSKTILAADQFLLGSQGYGAFETCLYDWDGTVRQRWPSHGYIVLTETGQIRLVEMENVLPSKMHFSILDLDGSVIQGPHLDDYYTTYPVLTRDNTTAFWRSGSLILIDAELQKHVLYTDPQLSNHALMSRMLLSEDGKLIFTLGQELWIADARLKPLAKSIWPCGGGNPQGNPVFAAQ